MTSTTGCQPITPFVTPMLLLSALLGPRQEFFDLPAELRERYKLAIQEMSWTGYEDEGYYQDLLSRLDARAFGRAEGVRLLNDLTQASFDHDRGNAWLAALAMDLEYAEMQPVAAAAVPGHVELLRVTLRDGRVLVGAGGPLARRFRERTDDDLQEQRYLDPNLGLPGVGDLWLARGDIDLVERVAWPAPRAALVAAYRESVDGAGQLVVEGHWFRPGRGVSLESIALDSREVTNGGVWFENAELGLRTLRLAADHPELAAARDLDDGLRTELGFAAGPPPPPPQDVVPAELVRVVDALRARAPDVEWPAPFDPDPARARAVLGRDDLVFGDPGDSLLRLRFALTYGDDLPDLALELPRAFLDVERRARAVLDGRPMELLLSAAADEDVVRAAIRHAPRLDREPGPLAPAAPVVLRVPTGASPWRRSPVLVALHGQGGSPSQEAEAWGPHCEREGVILVCPPHGEAGGARGADSDAALLDVVRRVLLSTNADPDRVYLTGISMGGARTWHLAQTHPDRFAAVSPELRGPSRYGGRFPLLPNLTGVPVLQLETEFDGENTGAARRAVFELRKLGGVAEYREAASLGHVRGAWRYAAALRWLLGHRRDPHPARVEHRAFHGFRAQNSWLKIADPGRAHAWDRDDGAFVLADLTGVEATLARGSITLRRTAGSPRAVELFHDPAAMGDSVRILGKAPRTWTPAPDLRATLERVLATGDRARLYGESIVVEL